MRIILAAAAALVASSATFAPAFAQDIPTASPELVEKYVKSTWSKIDPKGWDDRLVPDDTMAICNKYRNDTPVAEQEKIMAMAKESVKLPDDGNVIGDWKKGEEIAQDGAGHRWNDLDKEGKNKKPAGGNCYACHQMAKAEISYGTLGPSLLEYGKIREFKKEEAVQAYIKVYNSHTVQACSNMPRFGSSGYLTIEQIKDVVAFLFDPESPVNK